MTRGLEVVAADAARCTRCDLYARATQTVFGEGPATARVMLIGEQPGDREDEQGRPFVGPAGRVLDEVIAEAGLERADLYVTNAVKHFKWEPRGKRRIHQRPNRVEVVACRAWLDEEITLVDPEVIVALGATAGQALWGVRFRLGPARGEVLAFADRRAAATYHPSAVLRAGGGSAAARVRSDLVEDLTRIRLGLTHIPGG